MNRNIRRSAIALMAGALLGSLTLRASAQFAGSARQSLNRTQGTISSIQRNRNLGNANAGSASFAGSARQSIKRSQQAMASIHRNRGIQLRGLGSQAVHGTPDMAFGVYSNMYFRNQAVMRGTYGRTLRLDQLGMHGNTVVIPIDRMRKQMLEDRRAHNLRQRNAQFQAQGEEVRRRLERRNPQADPNGPVLNPALTTGRRPFPGSDMLLERPLVGPVSSDAFLRELEEQERDRLNIEGEAAPTETDDRR